MNNSVTGLFRVAAFAEEDGGGNPAGVWLGELLPSDDEMQQIATDVGYSETAFVAPLGGARRQVRYFSPQAEVPFCGHATIASGFVLGSEAPVTTYQFATQAGEVAVDVRRDGQAIRVALTSVATRFRLAPPALVTSVTELLGWHSDDLDEALPPALAFAGAWHLVLAVREKSRLDALDYDFDALRQLMLAHDLTTLQLVWPEGERVFHSRNPFPVGGVVEDPATGAAAAALGGYLRDASLRNAPFEFTIRQGEAMGRPSVIEVRAGVTGGVEVSGGARYMPANEPRTQG